MLLMSRNVLPLLPSSLDIPRTEKVGDPYSTRARRATSSIVTTLLLNYLRGTLILLNAEACAATLNLSAAAVVSTSFFAQRSRTVHLPEPHPGQSIFTGCSF
jgi:hypothetical protein